jgi:putative MFS transporter
MEAPMTETTGKAGTLTSQLLAARLERLPVSRFHYRLLVAGGLGFTFDAMDGAVLAFILPAVTKEWSLSSGAAGILASSLLIGYLFGALAAGILGDRIGRRGVMLNFLAVYSVASVVAAIAPNFAVLFIARVVAGIGTGAESAITAPYLSEFVPSRVRGRYIGSLTGFFAFGYVFASLLGYFMVSDVPNGWRWVQVISAAPIVMLLWWRRLLPESPRFLHAHGRTEEAEKVLCSIEEQVTTQTGRPLPPVRQSDAVDDVHVSSGRVADNLRALLSTGLRRTTITAWVYWFVAIFTYYGFFTWIPSLLVNQGFDISKSFLFSIVIYLAQIPGYYSAAFVSEWWERKWTIAIYLAGGALGALGLALAGSSAEILVWGIVLSFFMNGNAALEYSYTSEIYPTIIRTTGLGVASAIGRIGGITAPIIIGFSYSNVGFGGVFTMLLILLLVGAAVVAVFGQRTTGRSLESIGQETVSHSAGRQIDEDRSPTSGKEG